MVFSSLIFLFGFLPIFLLFYALSKNIAYRNICFLIFSLLFYFWGDNVFILILLASILINYVFGIAIDKSSKKNLVLSIAVAINLGILFYYKYIYFFTSALDLSIASQFGSITLPLGISFFTFQGISYLIDISREDAECEKNILGVGLYIAMFPQLIAGPIVRYKDISRQIKNRIFSPSSINYGILLFCIGLSYKVLIANNSSIVADQIFALNNEELSFSIAWLGVIAYTLQIYFDFNGYSTMAIGLGLILGFKYPVNFNFPYTSKSITEFWRKWHMTLSQWFRDYLYIPLGGNRKGKARTYINLVTIFVLCGFWHGASWTFLIWGLYHGLFLIIERVGFLDILKKVPSFISNIYCMIAVMLGWCIFRAESMHQVKMFFTHMFGFGSFESAYYTNFEFLNAEILFFMLVGIVLSTRFINQIFFVDDSKTKSISFNSTLVETRFKYLYIFIIGAASLLSILYLINQSYNPFIYFRF